VVVGQPRLLPTESIAGSDSPGTLSTYKETPQVVGDKTNNGITLLLLLGSRLSPVADIGVTTNN
jgi:hypothetical protein